MNGLSVERTLKVLNENKIKLPFKQTALFYLDSNLMVHGDYMHIKEIYHENSYTLDQISSYKICSKKGCVNLYNKFNLLNLEIEFCQNLASILWDNHIINNNFEPILLAPDPQSTDEKFNKLLNNPRFIDCVKEIELEQVVSQVRRVFFINKKEYEAFLCSDKNIVAQRKEITEFLVNHQNAPIAELRKILGYKADQKIISSNNYRAVLESLDSMKPNSLAQVEDFDFDNLKQVHGESLKERIVNLWRVEVERLVEELPVREMAYLNKIRDSVNLYYVDLNKTVTLSRDLKITSYSLKYNWATRVVYTDSLMAHYLSMRYNCPIVKVKDCVNESERGQILETASVLVKEFPSEEPLASIIATAEKVMRV